MLKTSGSAGRKRIAIIEHEPVFRASLANLVTHSAGWIVDRIYSDLEMGLSLIEKRPPDILVLSIGVDDLSGSQPLSLLNQVKLKTRILLVVDEAMTLPVSEALHAGAAGFLLRLDVASRLLISLDEVMEGSFPISSGVAGTVLRQLCPSPSRREILQNLTHRERICLGFLAQGLLYKEIASEMGINAATVTSHLKNIYQKLQVRTRTQAVVKFLSGP